MKAFTRYYIWWLDCDRDIQTFVEKCYPRQGNSENVLDQPLFSWNAPQWMTGIDAYSKWSEVEMMKTITKEAPFKKLREWFVRYGIPATIVTDNGPAFGSQEFKDFCGQNGIKHIPTSPNTPYKTTGQFPAELQMGKGLLTLLDRTKPHLSIKRDIEIWKQKMYQDRKSKSREFRIGEEVCVRNELNKGWSPGIIDHQTAELSYERNGAMDEPNRSEENDTSCSCKRYIPEKWQDYIILPTQKKESTAM
ncbi:Uncharacterized protein T02_15102 [Trichinella nativa]|uniref:Integrase catalytic domain-containing protein n=1 Tax=Trichinella nativa TaxID=6335 RepID=A0A0V1KYF7_9BILA|nr:Uncharacterized protein T02_15102 [Trichinella nativa]